MKRKLDYEKEYQYIVNNCVRYKNKYYDITSVQACGHILDWLNIWNDFNNVIYDPTKQKDNNLDVIKKKEWKDAWVSKCSKDKRVKHKKYTLERCFNYLWKDMYYIDNFQ